GSSDVCSSDLNEVLADGGKPAELLFLLDVLKAFLELIDGNSATTRIARCRGRCLRKLQKVISCVLCGMFAMQCGIGNHAASHMYGLHRCVGMLRQHRHYRHCSSSIACFRQATPMLPQIGRAHV